MRGMRALLALLMVAGALPVAMGQAPASLLEDASGDMQTVAAGNQVGPPGGRFAATDLVSLAVAETSTDLAFSLKVGNLAVTPEAPLVENTLYYVDFAHEAVVYRVMMYRGVAGDHAEYGGRLYVYDSGRDDFNQIESLVVTAEASANTITATVPRVLLLDQHGSAPFPGRVLTGFHAQSSSLAFGDFQFSLGPGGEDQSVPPTGVRDAMPNTGNGTLDFPIKLGLVQSGLARLSAEVPVRASNGEATTFVFPVNASNDGPRGRFQLSTVGVPGTWQVDLPSDLVEIPANTTVTIPVLVSMPFAHQHGTLQSFTLEMSGLDDPSSIGRVQLGVRFVQPPQPAGHHDTMYLHAFSVDGDQTFTTLFATAFGFDPNQMYFNTLAPNEDPNDGGTPVGGTARGFLNGVPPTQVYTWNVPLSPGLALGLDFDLARQGSIKLAVDSTLPLTGATLTGRLIHTIPDDRQCGRSRPGQDRDDSCTLDDFYYGAGQHVTAAILGPSAVQDVAPGAVGALFEAPIVATPAGDYLPFHPQATLVMQLNLTFTRVDPFLGPKDIPKVSGGEMVLPLLEYHDPVDQVFSSLSSLMINVNGEQQRMVNPGKTVLYSLELMNHGTGAASYDLEITGKNSHWAQILGDRRITIPGGASRALGVAVIAPPKAIDGDAADLVLAAVDTRDPAARTLARLLTTVDTEMEHPDDSSLVPSLADQLTKKDTPSAGLPLATLALAALAIGLRRRR